MLCNVYALHARFSLPSHFSCTASWIPRKRERPLFFLALKVKINALRDARFEAEACRDRSTHAKFTETGGGGPATWAERTRQLRRLVDATCNRWGFFLRAATFQATTPSVVCASSSQGAAKELSSSTTRRQSSLLTVLSPNFHAMKIAQRVKLRECQPRQRAVSTFLRPRRGGRCCFTVDKLVKCFSAVIRGAESLQQIENHRGCYI